MNVLIGDEQYEYCVGYQKNDKYRNSFNELALEIFDLSFENWFQAGYWNDKYIPHTLFSNNKAIANASVNILEVDRLGEIHQYIQIGTVMTDEAHRNKNLSRFLIEKIIHEWKSNCNMIYLYANKSVLDFYPKFGFECIDEYEHYKPIITSNTTTSIQKLNMSIQSNQDMLHDYAQAPNPYAKISMLNGGDLVMFYCTSFLRNNIYYIQNMDTIIVAQLTNDKLQLIEIFTKQNIELDDVITAVSSLGAKEISLGFTPKVYGSYLSRKISSDDILFVQKDKIDLFSNNEIMLPILSHA